MAEVPATPEQQAARQAEMMTAVEGAKASAAFGGSGTVQTPSPSPEPSTPAQASEAPQVAVPAVPDVPTPVIETSPSAAPSGPPGPLPVPEAPAPVGQVNTPPKVVPVETAPVAPLATAPVPAQVRPTWWNTVEQYSATAGVEPETLWKMFGAETSFGMRTKNPLSSARGPFQIVGDTWDDLAINHPDLRLTDRNDPEQQARAAPFYLRGVNAVLRGVLKRQPTPAESYLGWFAGPTGAAKVLSAAPGTPIQDVLSAQAIQSNPGVFSKVKTVDDLMAWAGDKMEGKPYQSPLQETVKIDLTPFLADGKDTSHLDGMGHSLKARLSSMIADMPPELQAQIKINSGFRSPERQKQLFDEAVAKYGSEEAARKWVAPPGRSQHNHGNAADLGFGSPAVADWVHQNATKYGLAFPMGHEPWHVETTDARRTGNVSNATALPLTVTTARDEQLAQAAREKTAWSTSMATWEALKSETAVGWMFDAMGTPKPDPNYSVSQAALTADKRLEGIPDRYRSDLLQSRSQAEYDQRVDGLKHQLEYERQMSDRGWSGTALRVGAGIVDPAGWLAAAALSPVGGEAIAAYKLGRIGRAFVVGGEAAAANMLTEVPAAMQNPLHEGDQLLYAGAGGFVFGTTVGALFKVHPEIAQEVAAMRQTSREIMTGVEAKAQGQGSSAGAMATPGHVEPVRGDAYDFTSKAFQDEEAQKSAFGAVRLDLAGQLKNDANPLVSALGGNLVEDAVGNVKTDVAVARAVSVEASHIRLQKELWAAQEYKAATAEYRERNKVSWWDWSHGEEQKFRTQIMDAIQNEDASLADAFDPAVNKMAGFGRKYFDSYLDLMQNPGLIDGTTRAAVRGAEDLPKNANYVPHIWDFQRFGEYVRRFGDNEMTRLVTDSIHDRLGGSYGEAEKIGKAFYKALRNVQAGQETAISHTLSGADKEGLRAFLRQATDLADGEINSIVTKMGPLQNTEGSVARLKQRQGLNPLFTGQLTDPRTGEVVGVSLKDLMERDFMKVTSLYNRTMSAQVALARLRIENPAWTPDAGPEVARYLVDGVRSSSDWAKVREQVFAVGDHLGHSKEATEKAWNRLDFAYKAISGHVHDIDKGKLGSFLRVLRDYNFMRVMNQVGFAQVADLGVMMSQVGLKTALANMPSLRAVMRDIKTGRMSTAEMRELEMIAMPGTDWIRGMTHLHVDDFGNAVGKDGFWGAAENVMQRGTRITSAISGMAPINAYIQRWAAKAAVAKFVTAAERGEEVLNVKRMRVLGISAEEQKSILASIKKHRSTFVDEETGRTVPTLNLEKWDPGARHAFEYGVFTWTRKMIQENDLGQMNTVLGTTIGKLLMQFRMFMFAGYTKNTLHNFHMRDWETASMILASSVLAAVPYAAQRYLQSIGRSDADKYREKHLSPGEIAKASFARAGWSSLAPMLTDLGSYALGMDPVFDTRVTGSPSQGLLSNPTFSSFDTAIKATRGVAGALAPVNSKYYSPFAQSDGRALVGTLPYSNALPFVWLTNAMVSHLPEKDSRPNHHN